MIEAALEAMRGIVGAQQVYRIDDPQVRAYRWLAALAESPNRAPAVVAPATLAELQAVITAAARFDIGLSVAPNRGGNGVSLAPPAKPSLIVALHRFNKVIEFNPDSGYALVEPGVSFDQLRSQLEQVQADYWLDADANGAHSICGSIYERASGYTPYGDRLLMQCGMEVITGAGELVRTGMGALPGSDTWQLFKYNYGPYVDGLFSHAHHGLITKVGLWLMPAPPSFFPFVVSLAHEVALRELVELMRPLKIGMVVPNTVVIANPAADRALAAGDANPGARNDDEFPWRMYGALYGSAENIRVSWAPIATALSSVNGARVLTEADDWDDARWHVRRRLMRGESAYVRADGKQDRALWFTAAAAIEGDAALRMHQIVSDTLGNDMAATDVEFALNWRTMLMRVSIPYHAQDVGATQDQILASIDCLSAQGFATTHHCIELDQALAERQATPGMRQLHAALGRVLDPHQIFGAAVIDNA